MNICRRYKLDQGLETLCACTMCSIGSSFFSTNTEALANSRLCTSTFTLGFSFHNDNDNYNNNTNNARSAELHDFLCWSQNIGETPTREATSQPTYQSRQIIMRLRPTSGRDHLPLQEGEMDHLIVLHILGCGDHYWLLHNTCDIALRLGLVCGTWTSLASIALPH